MKKNEYSIVKLAKGEVRLYDFGGMRLHAYQTNDPIGDEVFAVEKDGTAVLLESPCFYDNIEEFTAYLGGLRLAGMLVAYHGAGGSFLPDVPKYATPNAQDYSLSGGGKALIDNFAGAFGAAFDPSVHGITNLLAEGAVTIGGINFVIRPTEEAFDVEIPELRVVYTHMLGHDCHSIVGGQGGADSQIAQLRRYIARGYDLILTSHYTPEDLKDAQTKIDYLEDLKALARRCDSAEAFQEAARKRYPAYSGLNYLEMTAGLFFG